jgi:GNAT superfamily N-acetyltransferase
MRHQTLADLTRPKGTVRTLSQQEELPLLREHLLRLDRTSRHDRFHGFMDDSFVVRYAEKCANDGTVVIAYLEDGLVRGAAELHPPGQSDDGIPEIAFSVESTVRRQGVGTVLFRKLISVARAKGYKNLRITTGSGNEAMRALANKFGAHLTFSHGESNGIIDLARPSQLELAPSLVIAPIAAAQAIANFNRAYWRILFRMYGWGRDKAA